MNAGIFVIDKPLGMTSHDVVQRVRRLAGTRRVGHAGTLDPDASGVLVLCVEEATRLLEFLTADQKAYDAQITFGAQTDTDDATGQVIRTGSANGLTEAQVRNALEGFIGEQMQTVPRYSAVHIDGERAYDLARRGESFELPERSICIERLTLNRFVSGEAAAADVSVVCSKGTYIRSLARDLGEALGVPAHLSGLRRTASGRFTIAEATALSVLESMPDPTAALLPLEAGIRDLPQFRVETDDVQKLTVGQAVPWSQPDGQSAGEPVAVVDPAGRLVAVCQVVGDQDSWLLKPKKVFWKRDC